MYPAGQVLEVLSRVDLNLLVQLYSCYNPKGLNLFPSITLSVFGFFTKFFDQPATNPETNPNPVASQNEQGVST